MTRDEVFKLWPRPWRVKFTEDNVFVTSPDGEVLSVDPNGYGNVEDAHALAQMLVEWSQEKP